MRKLALLAIFLALPVLASAQYSGNGVPNLTCGANIGNAAYHDSVNGANYTCQLFNGVWQWRYTPNSAFSSLTTTGTSGAATLSGGVLNIPQYAGAVSSLTTTGTSGASTLSGGVLNIPNYGSGNSFAVDITQPPYNSKCDGHTDDHVAIQAALDANPAIYIPTSTSGITQCNLGTSTLTLCSASNPFGYNAIYGNGQILSYAGSGNMIKVASQANGCGSLIRDLQIDLTGASGTPILFNIQGGLAELDNDEDSTQANPLTNGSFTSIAVDPSGTVQNIIVQNYYGTGMVTISNAGHVALTALDVDGYNVASSANHVTLTNSGAESANGSTSTLQGFETEVAAGAFAGPVELGGQVSFSSTHFQSQVTIDNAAQVNIDAYSDQATPFIFSGATTGNIAIAYINAYPLSEIFQFVNGTQTNPATAPSGTCTAASNILVWSGDGHGTWCKAGTWTTAI